MDLKISSFCSTIRIYCDLILKVSFTVFAVTLFATNKLPASDVVRFFPIGAVLIVTFVNLIQIKVWKCILEPLIRYDARSATFNKP
jgi:hypothetical protein